MLAAGDGLSHLAAAQIGRRPARHPEVADRQPPPGERLMQTAGGEPDDITLRHGGANSLSEGGGLPRLRVLGELVHRGGQLAGRDVGERDLLQDAPLADTERDPDLLQRAGGAAVSDVLGSLAAHADQRTVDRADDVGQRYLLGRTRQPISPIGPALAADNAGTAQLAENILQEFRRYLLRLGELDGRYRLVVGH